MKPGLPSSSAARSPGGASITAWRVASVRVGPSSACSRAASTRWALPVPFAPYWGRSPCASAAVKPHPQLIHRSQQRTHIANRRRRSANRRDHELIRSFVLPIEVFPELAAGKQSLQHFLDVAVGIDKSGSELVDKGSRRVVGDKILREFEGDMTRRLRAARQNVERLFALRV